METVTDVLNDAIENNKMITIIYNGGSQPGTKRDIVPSKITGEYVHATCLSTHTSKTFKVSKIEIYSKKDVEDVVGWDIKNTIIEHAPWKTIDELYNDSLMELNSMGWHIEYEAGNYFSIHKVRKSGIPLKSYVAILSFQEKAADFIYDFETEDFKAENLRDKKFPWSIRIPENNFAKSYTNENQSIAISMFMDAARYTSPIWEPQKKNIIK